MKNISRTFIASIVFIIVCVTFLSYVILLSALPYLSVGVRLALSLFIGLFAFPVGLLLVFTVGIMVLIGIVLILYSFSSSKKEKNGDTILLEDSYLLDYLKKNYPSEQGTKELAPKNYALSTTERALKSFSLNINYERCAVDWYAFDGMYLARFYINQPTAPTLIINSILNDNSHANIDTKRLDIENIDLGSDFGNYFRVGYIEKTEVDALQVIDPSLMLVLLGQSSDFDIVVSQTSIDFKFTNIQLLNAPLLHAH